jgi:PAS domain S-box-containing protein
VCKGAGGDPFAREAEEVVRAVLQGDAAEAVLRYPCHAPDEERWFDLRAVDHEGQVVVAHEDVTAQIERERLFRRQAALVEAVRDAVVATDARLRITYWNPGAERLYGVPAEGAVGQDLLSILDPQPPMAREAFLDAARAGAMMEAFHQTTRGRRVATRGSLQAIPGDGGGFVAVFRDLTEVRLLQEEVGHAQRMEAVAQLAAGAAHDFGNLLMGMVALCEAGKRLTDVPEAHSALEAVREAAEHGGEMVRELTDLGRAPGPADAVEVDATLRRMGPMLRALFVAPQTLAVEAGAEGGWVGLRPRQLEQSVSNLVLNARAALSSSGHVVVRSRRQGDDLVLEVADDGQGMDRETVVRATEPWFSQSGGTGLGLTTVRRWAERAGGRLELESAHAEGTMARLVLPIVPAVPFQDVAPSLRPLEVLVIEDDPLVRATVRLYLSDAGHRVSVSRDVPADLSAYDAVVADVLLPTGAAGPSLGAHPEAPPVLYVTAHDVASLVHEGKIPMGAPVLRKPFDQGHLLEALDALLEPMEGVSAGADVLVVDPYRASREPMAELLREEGLEVEEAGSMEEALASAPPGLGLLVTDLSLPDGSGDRLADELRRSHPDLRVIFVHGQTDHRARGARAHAGTAMLRKPVDLERLAASVAALRQS